MNKLQIKKTEKCSVCGDITKINDFDTTETGLQLEYLCDGGRFAYVYLEVEYE